MKSLGLDRYALAIGAATALLAACGGTPPIGAPGAMPRSDAIAQNAERGGSWMLPEAKDEDLLYGTNDDGSVYVFSYPKTTEIGALKGVADPWGACVDRHGNVWITEARYNGKVLEYAHGGTEPIATLTPGSEGGTGCAVDPTSGNLAVITGSYAGGGVVSVFPRAKRKPITYAAPKMWVLYYCAYDDHGNLFVRGYDWKTNERLIELSEGSKTFVTVQTKVNYASGGAVQWDGTYLAVQGFDPSKTEEIDRLRVTGRVGTVEGIVRLDQPPGGSYSFWVEGGTIAQTSSRGSKIRLWRYPKGGKYINRFRNHDFGEFLGVAVSTSTRR